MRLAATPAALARCEAWRSAGWVLCSGSIPSEDIPRRPFRVTGGVLVAPGPKIQVSILLVLDAKLGRKLAT